MTHVLVKFKCDYADEFDVYGCAVMTAEEYITHCEKLNEVKYPVEWYFGTNKSFVNLEFNNADEYHAACTKTMITQEEYDTFCKLFGKTTYATWCNLANVK